jgi:hypothetical protein
MLTAGLSLLSVTMWADPAVSQIDGPNATYTDAVGINNRGEIVGRSATRRAAGTATSCETGHSPRSISPRKA